MAALKQAFVMLRPDIQWKNPVMFVVEVGAFLTLLFVARAAIGSSVSQVSITYFMALDVWLFLTVLFANFATAFAEARGKVQAESLRRTRRDNVAYRLRPLQRWRRGRIFKRWSLICGAKSIRMPICRTSPAIW